MFLYFIKFIKLSFYLIFLSLLNVNDKSNFNKFLIFKISKKKLFPISNNGSVSIHGSVIHLLNLMLNNFNFLPNSIY